MVTRTTAYVPQIKYINNADGKGWLIVKYNTGGQVPALPQFLKVKTYKVENGRSRLLTSRTSLGAGKIRFDIKNEKLWYGSSSSIHAFTEIKPNTSDPIIPLGTHSLYIPHEPHDKARGYVPSAKYAMTWFLIDTPTIKDRYLHPGRGSRGCVTVDTLSAWNNIYNYLIKRRAIGSKSVGTIEVFEGP